MKITLFQSFRRKFKNSVHYDVFYCYDGETLFIFSSTNADVAFAYAHNLRSMNKDFLVFVDEVHTRSYRHFLNPTIL